LGGGLLFGVGDVFGAGNALVYGFLGYGAGNSQVNFIDVSNVVAHTGNIYIRGGALRGENSGKLLAPGDVNIVVKNATGNYLRTNDLYIPEYSGGHIIFNYSSLGSADLHDFALVESYRDSAHPRILVENTDPGLRPNIEITGNFLLGELLSSDHYQSLADLLKNVSTPSREKGAIYLSPLMDSMNRRELLPRFFEIKEQSRLPLFVYLIQRL